jgi:ATP-dependent DNA ligase
MLLSITPPPPAIKGTHANTAALIPGLFNSRLLPFWLLKLADVVRERTRPGLGIIEPCLPSPAKAPASGPRWIHEIKHDGFRILARRDSAGVRLITRKGNDFSSRFPFIAMAVTKLPVRSCLIDGEAIVCNENGLAGFDLIRGHGSKASAVLCAFDLLELDGMDLRREPIEERKGLLAKLLKGSHLSIVQMSILRRTARSYFARRAGSVVKASCRSGSARRIARGVRRIGRRSKIQKRPL